MELRALTPDEKWMRKARLDDWCARNGVEVLPAVEPVLSLDELEEIGSARGYRYGRLAAVKKLKARKR